MNNQEIYKFIKNKLYSVVKDNVGNNNYPGFCSLLFWEFVLNSNSRSNIINFIKTFGNWDEKYYDYDGNNVSNDNCLFIYPAYDWDSRIKLIEKAIENYENLE